MAAMNDERRGEDSASTPMFVIIFVIATVVIGMIVLIVVSVSTHTSQTVINQQKDYSLYSGSIVQGIYSFVAAQYADIDNASCAIGKDFTKPVTITLRFKTGQAPQSCNIFVDAALLRTEHHLDADCNGQCNFTEYNRQYSIGNFDYRDSHAIRVCCDDICVDKQVRSLCH